MATFQPIESLCKQIQHINVTRNPLQLDDLKKLNLRDWPTLDLELTREFFDLLPEATIRRINQIEFFNLPDSCDYLTCEKCEQKTSYLLAGKCAQCLVKYPVEDFEDYDIEEGHYARVCDLCDIATNSKFGVWTQFRKGDSTSLKDDEDKKDSDDEEYVDLCQDCSQTEQGRKMIVAAQNPSKIEHPDPYGSLYDWYPISKYEEGWILWNLNSESPHYHQGAVFHYDDHYRVGIFTFPLNEILDQDQKKMDLFLKKKCLPTYYG